MMNKLIALIIISFLWSMDLSAQNKKMDHTTFDLWKTIEETQISNSGDWITYVVKPGKGDPKLHIYNTRNSESYTFDRAESAKIDENETFIAFRIHPPESTLDSLKRAKEKENKHPKDTLGIFHLENLRLEKIANLQSFKTPKKWGGFLCYVTKENEEDTIKTKVTLPDTTGKITLSTKDPSKKPTLFIRSVADNTQESIEAIEEYQLAEEAPFILWNTAEDTNKVKKIQLLDIMDNNITSIEGTTAEIKHLGIRKNGTAVYYMLNSDTTDQEIKPFDLKLWTKENDKLKTIAEYSAKEYQNNFIINEFSKPSFSDNGNRLFYGLREIPAIQDTSLLDDEIVNVEVWNYKDQVLYTQQNVRLEDEKKRNYSCYYNVETQKNIFLADKEVPQVRTDRDKELSTFIGLNDRPYQKYMSWLGHDYSDVYLINAESGTSEKVMDKVEGRFSLSPAGNYALWYSRKDSIWLTYNLKSKSKAPITDKNEVKVYSETNDRPMEAYPYGIASWIDDDKGLLVYDRYDIWLSYPDGNTKAKRITKGREKRVIYRYLSLDHELNSIPSDTSVMVHFHKQADKSEGYGMLNLSTGEFKVLHSGQTQYDMNVIKAKNSNDIIFTQESFEKYPDLQHTNLSSFYSIKTFSNANPQQKEYSWGTAELFEWVDFHSDTIQGLLIKPDNFDPGKKYPLLVNFYERNSHNLHRHRAPYPHRSTINYSYYVNKGYVIFNPDVFYRDGDPGASCYDAVMSGVDALLEEGFIDENNMGLQGHSWGGYQIAHLVTKTDRFKCAESGAPVVNMISAYGGIRWRSGLSRMFQYERTQSRLGKTLWEDPDRYLRNSPIFEVDKIKTPVLIMHNDKDGAVPWYQGIEFFVAMRRLNKPAWLLNYVGEPHWPVKRQNRVDFNRRMEQFFDHYLMGKPMPEWMKDGIPATEQSINLGYE